MIDPNRIYIDAIHTARRAALLAEIASLRASLVQIQARTPLLTVAETARLLDRSTTAVYALIHRGRIKAELHCNQWMLERSEVERWRRR